MLWNRYHFRVVLCWGNQIPETMLCVAVNAFFILLPTWDVIDLLSIDTGVSLVWYWGCVYGVQNCAYMGKENADTRPGSQPRNLSSFIASGGICLLGCTHFCWFFHLEWNHAYREKQQVLLKCIAYTPMFYHHFEVFFPPDCFKHDNSENKILSLESFSFFDNIVVVLFWCCCFFTLNSK